MAFLAAAVGRGTEATKGTTEWTVGVATPPKAAVAAAAQDEITEGEVGAAASTREDPVTAGIPTTRTILRTTMVAGIAETWPVEIVTTGMAIRTTAIRRPTAIKGLRVRQVGDLLPLTGSGVPSLESIGRALRRRDCL